MNLFRQCCRVFALNKNAINSFFYNFMKYFQVAHNYRNTAGIGLYQYAAKSFVPGILYQCVRLLHLFRQYRMRNFSLQKNLILQTEFTYHSFQCRIKGAEHNHFKAMSIFYQAQCCQNIFGIFLVG